MFVLFGHRRSGSNSKISRGWSVTERPDLTGVAVLRQLAHKSGRKFLRRLADGSWTKLGDDEDTARILLDDVGLSAEMSGVASFAGETSFDTFNIQRRKRGPTAKKRPLVEQQIRKLLADGFTPETLANWPQKRIKPDFGVSHQTYEKALITVFSAINSEWLVLLPKKKR
jgi:hypothetical protein